MTPEENVAIVRRLYDAMNAAFSEPRALSESRVQEMFGELCDPQIELRQYSALPGTAGTFRGYEGMRASVLELLEGVNDMRLSPGRHVAGGDSVVFEVKTHVTGRTSGARVEFRAAHLIVFRAGRVVRAIAYPTFEEALAAAGFEE